MESSVYRRHGKTYTSHPSRAGGLPRFNYWRQKATACGHDARLISAKRVANIRPNQKTDKNDALAIVQASQLTGIQFITGKTFSQQELQSISKMRELAVKQKVALTNQISALLLEFNIRVSPRNGGLSGVVQATLEEAEWIFSGIQRSVSRNLESLTGCSCTYYPL